MFQMWRGNQNERTEKKMAEFGESFSHLFCSYEEDIMLKQGKAICKAINFILLCSPLTLTPPFYAI